MDPRTGELAIIVDESKERLIKSLYKNVEVLRGEIEAEQKGFVPLDKQSSRDAHEMLKAGKNTVPLSHPANRHERRLMEKRRRLLAKRQR